MPLSTSNSNGQLFIAASEQEQYFPPPGSPAMIRAARIATACLLTALALVSVTAELAARYLYPRLSHLQQRIVNDEHQLTALTARQKDDSTSVLLVGNSLLLHGLDYPRIRKNLEPQAHPVRYVIENTEFLDWYYGLRRLFAEGVKPTKLALCLNLSQMLSNGVLSSSPWQLFRSGDLLAVSRAAGMDTTQTSNLVLSHFSAFYASREEIRNYLLNVVDPPYANELHRLARQRPQFPSDDVMLNETRTRLRELNKLCRDNGVQFVMVVPPALSTRNDLLQTAAALEGVEVYVPVPAGSLGAEFFLDGFHLNDKGAAVFTEALTRELQSH